MITQYEEKARKVILAVLEKAEEKYPECFEEQFNEKSIETDWDMENFVAEKLGYDKTWWYTGSGNCYFVVNVGSFYFDVDYKTLEIEKITEEEFLEVYGS